MKSFPYVASTSLLAFSFACAASPDERPDFVELVEQGNAQETTGSREIDDEFIERFLLVDPAFPYSELREPPAMLAEIWQPYLKSAGIDVNEGFRQLARRFGMTKARPTVDVQLDPSFGRYEPFVAAQVIKAGVDPDIFRQAIEHFQFHRSAIAANFAVAAQLVRDRMRAVDPENYDAAYIQPDVLDRFMALRPNDEMTEFDAEYLEAVLSAETQVFRPERKQGEVVLPPQFRVARIAAAYHDRTGYFDTPPCLPSAAYRPNHAGTGAEGDTRELCLVDATDRAVYAWYLDQYRRQSEGIKRYADQPVYDSALLRLLRPIAIVSEAMGIVSFIRFSTGMRLLSRGKVPSGMPDRLRSKVNQKMCRK